MCRTTLKSVLVALSLLVLAAPLHAQAPGSAAPARMPRIPVTIVLVDEMPAAAGDAAFVILRRADLSPHDVIVLHRAADRSQLSEAVRTLIAARQAHGDSATTGGMVRMSSRTAQGRRPDLPWIGRVLADLRRAERKPVPGVGAVQAVEIWLPAQRPRGARP